MFHDLKFGIFRIVEWYSKDFHEIKIWEVLWTLNKKKIFETGTIIRNDVTFVFFIKVHFKRTECFYHGQRISDAVLKHHKQFASLILLGRENYPHWAAEKKY